MANPARLRLTDVKAEHYERKVSNLEAERDHWEKKYTDVKEELTKSKEDLQRVTDEINAI